MMKFFVLAASVSAVCILPTDAAFKDAYTVGSSVLTFETFNVALTCKTGYTDNTATATKCAKDGEAYTYKGCDGSLQSVTLERSNKIAEDNSGNFVFGFTLTKAIPGQTGLITITFPAGFDVTDAALTGIAGNSVSANAGTWVLTKDNGTKIITLTRTTATADTGATDTLKGTLTGIKNKGAGPSGTFLIKTLNTNTVLDNGVAPGFTISTAETGSIVDGGVCVKTKQASGTAAEKCLAASYCKDGTTPTKCAARITKDTACTQEGSCVTGNTCQGTDGAKTCKTSGAFSYGFTMLAVLAAFFL